MSKIKIDLHEIFNKGEEIENSLNRAMSEAIDKKIPLVEIITGKGSGELKKHVLRYLAKPATKALYFRIEKDYTNFGRIFVRFRHKNLKAYH